MEYWTIQKGIVLNEIEGVYLLVADQEGRKHCPYIKQINETGAVIYKQMLTQKTIDEIISMICEEYGLRDSPDLKNDINSFIQSLSEANYIILKS